MTSPEQLKTNAVEGSRLPVRRNLYQDPEVQEKMPVAKLGQDILIENSRPRPVSPVYSDMSLKMAEQFNMALKGDVSPEEAVKSLQQELQSIANQAEEAT
jgi:trehalose/maltose transport system substrate-binding protein